ncbi:MAG: N-formylglutamate amidohydrolase [Phyllobacteriaceae bacterium]|nr:N-formylglutamate amidohydrolase [Phyllobacteriaceae bacterium]
MAAAGASGRDAVSVVNEAGKGPFVLACDHASNRIPAGYGTFGLPAADLQRHIAWDPGALAVSEAMAATLGAPLVASTVSRLLVDCNRPLDAPDLIWEVSEDTRIPGNLGLSQTERRRRIDFAWRPFHDAIDRLIETRLAAGSAVGLVTVHSYTPVWKGVARPWHVGIIHDEDERLSAPLLAGLRAEAGLVVGDNQPYSPADRVYFTLERHARSRGLPCGMIEIRNGLIADARGQDAWADKLTRLLAAVQPAAEASAQKAGVVRHA